MLHADVLGERARLSPDRTALVFVPTSERLSYATLDERATRMARLWLGPLALSPGDRVGLLAPNAIEFVDAFFAAAKSGVILVPLGTRATAHELEGIVADSGPRVLVYGPQFAGLVSELRKRVVMERWIALAADAREVVAPGLQPHASEAVAPGRQPRRRSGGDDLLQDLLATVDAVPFDEPWPDPEHPLCLLYTSGTTGTPKGVVVPHRMVAWNAYNTAICWQLTEDDVSPIFTPLYHAGGLGAFLLPIFAAGGTIVLHRAFDPTEVWTTIEREGCTVVLGVPTIYKLLMDAPEFPTVDLSRVRWLISGGAPLPHYVIAAYQRRGVAFKQGYGLTEVGVNCFAMSVEDSVRKAGTIGRPLMFTRARLVRDDGAEAGVDEVGELWLRGPHVCRGYWNNPKATTEALDDHGWFHTGDLAKRDADGFYTIAGRQKDMIISGGVNVYPAEIEAVLAAHPQVADAAVVGVSDETWGEVGVAFVVRAGGDVNGEALADYVGTLLARYKVPRAFVFVDALPRTPYGKVVKDDLRKAYSERAR